MHLFSICFYWRNNYVPFIGVVCVCNPLSSNRKYKYFQLKWLPSSDYSHRVASQLGYKYFHIFYRHRDWSASLYVTLDGSTIELWTGWDIKLYLQIFIILFWWRSIILIACKYKISTFIRRKTDLVLVTRRSRAAIVA